MHQRHTFAPVVLFCFFLSGVAGLIYEILWTRAVTELIGAAPFAVAIVLTIFMGGLGLGSYLAGRRIDRVARPDVALRIYAILELVVAACALLLPFLISALTPVWRLVYNSLSAHFLLYNLAAFIAASALFAVPVICMGATLPVLTRFYVTGLNRVGTNLGRLYGLNTLGAAVGSFLCGFLMIQYLGTRGSLAVAVALNVLIGLVCLVLARHTATAAPTPADPSHTTPPPSNGYPSRVTAGALIVFAVSGFCSMAAEVTWTRLLGLLIGPTTYSFTIVLVTFILGLALGSIIFGRLADRTGRPIELLLLTQVLAAALILAVSHLLGNSQLFFAKLIAAYREDFILLNAVKGGILVLVLILPTVCLGATFPLVGKIITRSTERIGRLIGGAYAVNTAGAVLGSFLAGFFLLPLLGAEHTLRTLVLIQGAAVVALVALASAAAAVNRRTLSFLVAGSLLVSFGALRYPHFDRLALASGKYMRFENLGFDLNGLGWVESLVSGSDLLASRARPDVLYCADGVGGAVAVLEDRDLFGNTEISLTCSGKPDASTRGDMATQTLLAHVPLIFHPDARSVMVLGLASGITAGEILLYPVESLDVVEISPEVVEASRFFDRWNGRVLDDPRTNLIVQDGRAHLMLADRTYDVIISEPSNPWMAGLAALFTREFFTYARDRLRPGGIFVQFLHAYSMDWPTFALVGRTFAEIFPHSVLVSASPGGFGNDYLLVGFRDRVALDSATARKNVAYASRSRNVHVGSADQFFPLIVAENTAALFGSGPTHRDRDPRLEFIAPKLMFSSDRRIVTMLAAHRRVSEAVARAAAGIRANPAAGLDYARFALSVYQPFPGMMNLASADSQVSGEYRDLICDYCRTHTVDMNRWENGPERPVCIECQVDRLRLAIDSSGREDLAWSYLVKLLIESGRLDEAADAAAQWVRADSSSVEALINSGIIAARLKDPARASSAFEAALGLDPDNAVAHHNLACARMDAGDFAAALPHFRHALRLRPDFAEARCFLGLAYLEMGQRDSAIVELTAALRLQPNLTAARAGLARAATLPRNP